MTEHPFVELRKLLQEAHKLGAKFQLRGADVAIVGADALQASLRDALERHRQAGTLWTYLGGDEDEEGPNALLEALDVTPRLVETVPKARTAVRQLIRDLRRHGGFLAIDTETFPKREFEEPVCVELNATGALSGRPRGKDQTKKPPALDPHRARIRLLQAYAGGRFVFLFRHEALGLIARSHWLRRQKVVFHNAAFDVGMLRAFRAPRLPTPRQQRGSFHCNMQASGLVLGLGGLKAEMSVA